MLLASHFVNSQVVYKVSDFGAVGDGVTDDASAIQRAIDKCAADGGGVVLLPGGHTYMASPIQLKSYVNLHVEASATLKAIPDEGKYHLSAFGANEGEGMMWIYAEHAERISISGQGVIHGNGIAFMGKELEDSYELKPVTTFDPRPHVLTLIDVKGLVIRDVTICEGAYWTVHLIGCNDAVIEGINLLNNLKIRNGDGIDLDHSSNVRIANCHITSGDDCICLKNRREYEQYGSCHDIVVTNCVMTSRSCAIKIGSENMDVWWGKAEPIYVTSYPRANGNHKDANWRFPKGQIEGRCGEVSRIYFNNITATSENGCFIGGDTPEKVNDIHFNYVRLHLKRVTDYPTGIYDKRPCRDEGFVRDHVYGLYVENATNVTTTDFQVDAVPGIDYAAPRN